MSLVLAVPPRCSVTSRKDPPLPGPQCPYPFNKSSGPHRHPVFPQGWGPAPSIGFRAIASKNNSP